MQDNYNQLLKELKRLSLSRNKCRSIRLNNRLTIYNNLTKKELEEIEKPFIQNENFLNEQMNKIRNMHKDLKYYVI